MYFPKNLFKNDLILGLTAAAAVLLSGLAMNRLAVEAPSFAIGWPVGPAGAQELDTPNMGQLVSQAAIASDARADMPAIATAPCAITLELMDEGNAMMGGTLLAPCLPNQDLVIAHAGMVYSAKTLASGALFFSLPALKHPATVDIRFTTGETAAAQLDMPDVLGLQRLAVQWPFQDGFTLHAFENGAEFGGKGHIWLENTNSPAGDAAPLGGYLTTLGDANVDLPLLAQVYTFAPDTKTDLLIEAAVTDSTCATDLMGDVMSAKAGAVQKVEVTVAMPDCAAVGEFVQLPVPDFNVDVAMAN